MNEAIDYSTVKWVKQELDATLKQARQALEAYVENTADDSSLRLCAVHLHQVYGTLQMVELYGAALLAEEMEQVIEALLDDAIGQKHEAYELLMRAILQLPDYLERLVSGYRDVPLVLLPLLNDLRAIRGQKLLSENSLFAPNLDQVIPDEALLGDGEQCIQDVARKVRHQYQLSLLGWYRGKDVETNLDTLASVVRTLQSACGSERCQRLWWVAGGLIAALRNGWLETSMASRLMLGQIDRQIKKIVDEGESALTDSLPTDLLKNLLFYVARANDGGQPVSLIKKTYNLSALLPDDAELEHAQSSLSGHNSELMQTVAVAIREDMARVKDALDLFQRGGRKSVAELQPASDILSRIGDTLSMLGLGGLRKVAQEQAQSAVDMVAGRRPAEESALMDVAGALLFIESSLETLVQGGAIANDKGADSDSSGQSIPDAEFNQVRRVVADEAIRDIAAAKDAFLAFIEDSTDFEHLERVPLLFHQIKGGLMLLNEQRAASLLDAVRGYVAERILDARLVPEEAVLDDLADAISSVEYYLESLRDGRMFSGTILDVAENSLHRLHSGLESPAIIEPVVEVGEDSDDSEYISPPEANGGAEPAVDVLEDMPSDIGFGVEQAASDWNARTDDEETISRSPDIDSEGFDHPVVEGGVDVHSDPTETTEQLQAIALEPKERGIEERADWNNRHAEQADGWSESSDAEGDEDYAVPAEPELASLAPELPVLPTISEDIDEEILEIFIEESEEELANISEYLPRWLNNEEDRDALVDMRRSFHTLKGSGRLVGAARIGEFAWAYENMLNRLIDGTVRRTPVLCGLLEHGVAALPELIAQIRDGEKTTLPIELLADKAQAYSQGKPVDLDELSGPDAPQRIHVPELEQEADVELDILASALGDEEEAPSSLEMEAALEADTDSHDNVAAEVESEPATESSIDPVLCEIFSAESRDHIATVRSFLGDCRKKASECRVTDEMLRAFHTLHGSARMAGADAIAEIAYEIEKYGKALRNDDLPMPHDGMHAVADAMKAVERLLERLSDPASGSVDHGSIVEEISRLPRTTENVEHIPSAEVPEELEDDMASEGHDFESDLMISGVEDLFAGSESSELNVGLGSDIELTLGDADDPFVEESFDDILGMDGEAIVSFDEADPFAEMSAAAELLEDTGTGIDVDVVGQPIEADAFQEEAAEPASSEHVSAVVEEIDSFASAPSEEGAVDVLDAVSTYEISQEPATDGVPVAASSSSEFADETFEAFNYDDADQDLLEVFLEEGVEILEASDATLHKWVHAPDDRALMSELQRHLHTLKGGARMAGVSAIGNLSHSLESLLIAVVDGQVAPGQSLFEVLLVAQDLLINMLEALRDRKPIRGAESVINKLEALRRGVSVATLAPVQASAALSERPGGREVEAAEASASSPDSRDADEEAAVVPAEEHKSGARTQHELVRVRADLLDSMVNYAGEISIYRSRMEQQVGSMRFNLAELGQTVDRIRDQLRKMEIETEAQVLFRYEREGDSGEDQFDPLEMDRYSHLQQLSRSMMESISDLVSIQGLMDNITRESETLLLQQSRVNTELQEGLMRTRMVPFAGLAPRMRRIVRQVSHEVGKRAELVLEGTEGEMDRTVIDRIIAPLEHMLRNAIAHGIESPERRKAVGKRETGTIKVSLSRDGSEVVIQLADDGAGMNLDAIKRKARERGLLTEDSALSDTDIMQFVLETGFSTAEKVSQIAGRGVGMDVVNSEVKQLGGSLHIDSREGQGTTFTIRLPFTLAISQALLVQVQDEIYAIPLTGIEGIVRINQDELSKYLGDPASRFEYAGYSYPVNNLGAMLGHGSISQGVGGSKRLPVLLVRSGDHRMALQVESLLGSREAVVKSVGPQISTVRGISGATILGDGRVVLILDLGGLLRAGGMTATSENVVAPTESRKDARPTLVMVVDDSITVRKVTTRLLERNEMEVVTAKDGVDAVAKLQEYLPDVMLLDIEMPRMDGFELATHVRNEPRLRHIPIIMITSRTGDKHRNRAMEIGVNRYLGKPFQESDLLENIRELTEERALNG